MKVSIEASRHYYSWGGVQLILLFSPKSISFLNILSNSYVITISELSKMNATAFRVLSSSIRSSVGSLNIAQIIIYPIKCKRPFDAYNFVRAYSSLQTSTFNHSIFQRKENLKFLSPIPAIIVEQPKAGMKLVSNPKRRCKHCYIVIEEERKYVFCDKYPRHKQAQIRPGPIMKVSRIMTHATQGGIKTSARMGMWTQQGLREDY